MDDKLKSPENDNLEEIEEVTSRKVVPLRVVTGGKGPPSTNWLQDLPIGSIIVIKDKNSFTPNCGEFTIVHKTDKTVKLINPTEKIVTRVIPNIFCNMYSLVEILGIVDLDIGVNDE